MSLLENILDIFFVDEKTEKSVELTIKEIEQENTVEKTELQKEEPEKQKEEEHKQKEKEEHKQKEKEEHEQKEEDLKYQKDDKEEEKQEVKESSEKKSKDLGEELQDEIKKIHKNTEILEEKLSLKPLQLYVYNEYLDLLKNLNTKTLLIMGDKEQKRKVKKLLLENNINNVYIISSLKDLKRKITTIKEIKNIIIEGELFENNKRNVIKILNVESMIQYSVFYPLSEYKTVIKTFAKKQVKLITNRSTFKNSKFQAIAKKLKISDEDIML
jgi:hypothetical protein